jgi:hypothetical protein
MKLVRSRPSRPFLPLRNRARRKALGAALLAPFALPAAIALSAAGIVSPASAQIQRPFPADSRLGVFEITAYPEAAIDGKPVRLAAGAQIRNRSNLIVLPTTVVGPQAVRYRLDPSGQLSRVWVLTPAEIEAAKAAQRP